MDQIRSKSLRLPGMVASESIRFKKKNTERHSIIHLNVDHITLSLTKKIAMKKQLLFMLFFLSAMVGSAQQIVTGIVTSADDKLPVIGASVKVKGTSRGTITDIDGKYSIKISKDSVLVFTYIGMEETQVRVGTQSVINVVMKPSSVNLNEVVVTAMGVKTDKKKLNFAVQSLSSKEIVDGQSSNFVSTLQGKIAGIQTSNGGGSPNASTQIIVRAISSINPSQNNEPLFIVDGMPVNGKGSAAGDINPNDIESMTVLKGAAASALYGQEAANGAIIITTKSGKAGQVVVNANLSVQVDNAVRVPKIQRLYGPGSQGFFKEYTSGGWGPLLSAGEKVYDNVGEFLGTGLYQKYDVSASGGTDKFNAYASVNYSKNDGVVVNDYKDKMGLLLKANYDITKNLSISMESNFIETKSRGFGNSMSSIYSWPINDNMRNYKYADGSIRWLYDMTGMNDDEKMDVPMNPYWSRYKDYGLSQSQRNILQGSVDWKPVKDMVISGKVSYDRTNSSSDSYTVPRFKTSDFDADSTIAENHPTLFGEYDYSPSNSALLTLQGLGTYKFKIQNDIDVNLLAGVEMKDLQGVEASMGGANFILPGEFYSYQNVDENTLTLDSQYGYSSSLYHYKQNKFGYFGEIRLDYKGIAQLSATNRVDMSSTLSQKTYFYPSVTGGLVFSELFNLSNDFFSYGKIRGNWAKVGKEGPRYTFDRSFKQWSGFPDGGFGIDAAVSTSNNLYPEMTKSWEVGTNLWFFNNKTKLDLAYYSTTVSNQIVTVRVSPASGMILQTRNEGAVKNYGVEAQLVQEIFRNKDFEWTGALNFSLNRGEVVSLPENVSEIQGTQYGDIFPTAYLHGSTTAISGKDYMRSPSGKVICDENGYPMINPAKGILIGNREPDFLLGFTSSFQWKSLFVSFLLDTRKGGDVVNVTGRSLFSSGQARAYEKYRNREVIVDGVVKQSDGSYVPNTTPIIFNQTNMNNYFNAVSSNFIEDGSYIRMSYITLGYDLSNFVKKTAFKGLRASITGRNLFLLTKYSGSDPQISTGSASGTGGFGIDDFQVPSTRSFNLTINATF